VQTSQSEIRHDDDVLYAPGRRGSLFIRLLSAIPLEPMQLLARFSLAAVFWMSARTKVAEGTLLSLSDNALWLFREEYKLPLLPPELAAHLSLLGEHLFPMLLVVGLASRFAALGLLFMTAVIEIFVYPAAYPVHGPWAVCCLVVIVHGPGLLSLDRLIARRFAKA
jgi:putative oxidoreductase